MFEFFAGAAVLFSGNETEQQGGCVFGTETELGIRAFAKPNGTDTVKIESEEFGNFEIEIGDTEPKAEEAETFAALVRGIMNCFIESGNIFGGFEAKIVSEIPKESGLSSTETFEILIGKIISGLFFENSVPALRLAEFGKIAEENYFGRHSNLSGRIISALGKTVFIDFSDPEMPAFEKIPFDFEKRGYNLAAIESKADSFEDHAETVKDLVLVSWNMGRNFLSEADEAEFIAQFPILRQKCGEKAVLNSLRFFEDSRIALNEFEALLSENFDEFLEIFKKSSEGDKGKSKALDFAADFLGEKGGAKISGDFSKTVLAILPAEIAEKFAEEAEKQGFGVLFLL